MTLTDLIIIVGAYLAPLALVLLLVVSAIEI
jgi:hypothetical protein